MQLIQTLKTSSLVLCVVIAICNTQCVYLPPLTEFIDTSTNSVDWTLYFARLVDGLCSQWYDSDGNPVASGKLSCVDGNGINEYWTSSTNCSGTAERTSIAASACKTDKLSDAICLIDGSDRCEVYPYDVISECGCESGSTFSTKCPSTSAPTTAAETTSASCEWVPFGTYYIQTVGGSGSMSVGWISLADGECKQLSDGSGYKVTCSGTDATWNKYALSDCSGSSFATYVAADACESLPLSDTDCVVSASNICDESIIAACGCESGSSFSTQCPSTSAPTTTTETTTAPCEWVPFDTYYMQTVSQSGKYGVLLVEWVSFADGECKQSLDGSGYKVTCNGTEATYNKYALSNCSGSSFATYVASNKCESLPLSDTDCVSSASGSNLCDELTIAACGCLSGSTFSTQCSYVPTNVPTAKPTPQPTISPTRNPSQSPTLKPTKAPSVKPTKDPSIKPTKQPSVKPTNSPTREPSEYPSANPTIKPTSNPTIKPTTNPTIKTTANPTMKPTANPTIKPTTNPTIDPTINPTTSATLATDAANHMVSDLPKQPLSDSGSSSTKLAQILIPVSVIIVLLLIVCAFCFWRISKTDTKPDESANKPFSSDGRTNYCETIELLEEEIEQDEGSTNISSSNYALTKPIKYVDNALVLFFGISKYHHETYPDLDDIDDDEHFFRQTFEGTFGYRFIANDFNKQWSKTDALDWIEDIRNKHLIPNNCVRYNALIFCGAAHGSMHSMITSDGKQCNVKDIRSLFAWNVNKKFRNLPKIFVFNCCRTKYTAPRTADEESCAAGYCVSITGTEGDPVFGSKLSRYVANAFTECHQNKKDSSLHDIFCKAVKTAKEEDGMQLRLQEHDMEIDNVVFMKNAQSRGSRKARVDRDTRQRSKTNELLTFLRDIKMEKFYVHLQDNGYKTTKSLVGIDEDALKKVGIESDKDRKKILSTIALQDKSQKNDTNEDTVDVDEGRKLLQETRDANVIVLDAGDNDL